MKSVVNMFKLFNRGRTSVNLALPCTDKNKKSTGVDLQKGVYHGRGRG